MKFATILLFALLFGGCGSHEAQSPPGPEPSPAPAETVVVHDDPCMHCVADCRDAKDPKACRKACRLKCCQERAEEDK